MRIKNKISIILTILATLGGILLISFDFSSAQATREMDVTAYMMDGQDKEIPNGEYDVRFAIYMADRQIQDPYPSDLDSTSRIWEEVQKVTMIDGILTARLGSVTPLPASLTFSGGDYYLGVRVNTDSEMVPRRKITAVPLAINAINAGNTLLLQGAKLGVNEGDVPQLGVGGKFGIKMFPTGTSSSSLVLGNDSRFHSAITMSGSYTYITLSGQDIVRGQINLSTDVSGTLPVARGGTGASDFTNLIALGTDTTGDYVATISAGNGISGSSSTEGGTPTLDIGAGNGITVAADSIAISLLGATDGAGATSSYSGMEFAGTSSDQLSLIQGCANNEVLSWNEADSTWGCSTISGVGGITGSGVANQVTYWTGPSTLAGENQLNVSRGGTGLGSYTIGDILYASGATTLSQLADVATGNALISGGIGVAPSWGKIGLTTHVSGILPVANGGTGINTTGSTGVPTLAAGAWSIASALGVTQGGTGLSTYTAGDMIFYSSGNSFTATPGGSNGQILGWVGSAPTWQNSPFVGAHNLLSLSHPDTIAASPLPGDLVIGANVLGVNKWTRFGVGAAGQFLSNGGTDLEWRNTSSITALGTITSGIWNGTIISTANGGTGASSLNDLIALTTDTTGNYVATITAGNGISGSSTTEGGTPTLSVNLLTSADSTGGTSSNSGLEFQGSSNNQLTLLQGCATNEVLAWNEGTGVWQCSTVSGVGGLTGSGVANQVTYWTGPSTLAGENQLNVSRGGTGLGSYTIGDMLYATGATTLSQLADVATGNALISGGIGMAPSWGKIGLTTHVSGILPVANGGTGASSLNDLIALTTDTTGNYVATITAGNGISGSSSTEGGTPTLSVNLLTSADSTGGTSSNSGLEFQGSSNNQLTLLQGCATNEVLAWNEGTGVWQCSTVSGVGGLTGTGANNQVTYWTGTNTLGGENQLSVTRGGTGLGSYTIGDMLYATGATTLSQLADVATGNALISGGIGMAPSWGKIGLTTHVSGILPVANGGTGANLTDPNADRIMFWDDTAGAVTWLSPTSNLAITTTTLDLANSIQLGSDGNDGSLTIYSEQGATDYTTTIQPGTQTQNVTYTLPADDGTPGDVLQTNGSGALTWVSVSGAGAVDGTGSANAVAYWVDNNTLTYEAQLAMSRGGTGANLTDPNADRLMFWDDSGTTVDWLTAASNFSISATTFDLASSITLGTNGVASGVLNLFNDTTDYKVVMQTSNSMIQDTTYTLPVNDGDASQVLITNGSGLLSWSSISGVGALDGTGSANAVAYWVDNNTLTYEAQLAMSRGGTGANLTDPNADRIMFWDDTAGAVTWLSPTSNLAITTTTLDLANSIQLGSDGNDGSLTIYSEQGATDYTTTIQPGTQTQNVTYTLPADDGASSQVLVTNGSGALSWSSVSGVGGVTGTGANNQVAYWNGTSSLAGENQLAASRGGTGIDTSGGGTTGVPIISSGTWSVASALGVSRGGTGVSTFGGINTLLYTTTADTMSYITAGTNGQIFVGVTSSAPAFATLSGDATIDNAGALTISNNAVALTTDTTGSYVATITAGNGISGSSSTEGGTPTLSVNLLTSADSTGGTSSNSGLEFQGSSNNQLTLLQGCATNEVLAWNEGTGVWQCSTVSGVGGLTGTGANNQVTYWTGTNTLGGENQLSVTRGGTGLGSYTIGDMLYATGATTLSQLADVATGNALISGGIGVAPSWGKIGLTTHVSGILPVANGGTGINTTGSTGVPTLAAGAWFIASALGVTLGGTGETSEANLENKIEGYIFDADAESITGVWTTADNVALRFGTDGDISTIYSSANSRLEWTDGSNVLAALTDAGTVGNLYVTGGISTYDSTVTAGYGEFTGLCLGNGTSCITSWSGAGAIGGSGSAGYATYWSSSNTLTSEPQLATSRGGTGIDTSASGGVPYISTGTWAVDTNYLSAAHGGTGIGSYSPGDILYATGTTALSRLAGSGTNGWVLKYNTGTNAPYWDASAVGHTQNTDTGTDGTTFTIGDGSTTFTIDTAAANDTINIEQGTYDSILSFTQNGSAAQTYTFTTGGTVCTTGSVCAGYQASGSYLTAEADTLATVTARGSITNGQTITVGPAATYDPIIISAIAKGTTSYTGTITSADLLSANRTWTFPDADGTVAMTSQLHNALTIGTPANGLSLSTQQLSLGLASAGVTGALSGTDWTTFNSKEAALTFNNGLTRTVNTVTNNLITGLAGGQTIYGGTAANEDLTIQGTTNATKTTSYVVLQPSGGNVGIGTVSPATALHVLNTGTQLRLGYDATHYYDTSVDSSGNVYHKPTSGLNYFNTASLNNRFYVYDYTDGGSSYAAYFGNGYSLVKQGVSTVSIPNTGSAYFNQGNVGIGDTTPEAYLQIKAGTAAVNTAPLKFTAGVNLTTAEAGAMEYDGSELYFTPSGTTRETIAYMSDITSAAHNPITLGAIGSTPNANGMTLSTQVLNLEPASASFGGIITTGTQTFAGDKTFNGSIVLGDATSDIHGINTAAAANSMLTASYDATTDVTSYFINGMQTSSGDTSTSRKVYGYYLDQNISGTDTGNKKSADSYGLNLDIDDTSIVNTVGGPSEHNMFGIYSDVNFGGTNTSNYNLYAKAGYFNAVGDMGTTGDARHYGLQSNVSGTADINYGLFINSSGATTNYAIYANSGLNYFAGNVGIGVTSPLAYLQIKAGTAAVNTAPLKFTTGVNLTTAEAGAMEYDGTELYFTPSGTTRETIAYLSDITGAAHNPVTINATANGLSVDGSQVLTLGLASSGVTGALSGTDWTTFNAKESALTFSSGLTRNVNTITNNLITGLAGGQTVIGGTGTTDDLIFKTTTGVGASGADMIFQTGSNGGTEAMRILYDGKVGIGTPTPGYKLSVTDSSGNAQLSLAYDATHYTNFTVANDGQLAIDSTGSAAGSIMTIGDNSAEDSGIILNDNTQSYYLAVDNTDSSLKIGNGTAIGTNAYLTINSSGAVRFNGNLGILESGGTPTYYTIFQGGDQAADITYTLPTTSATGLLKNTAGVLSWDTTSYLSDGSVYALLAGRSGGQTLIGGTATTDDLILRTTTANAVSGADMIFQTGSNGGTEAMRIAYNGNIGINLGTAPAGNLDIRQRADGNDIIYSRRFTDTASTGNFLHFLNAAGDTDIFSLSTTGSLSLDGGSIAHDASTGITTIDNLQLGAMNFPTDGGILSWIDMPVTSAAVDNTVESYSAQLDGNPMLTIYGLSDGAGGVDNLGVGIGTTTPGQMLSVAGTFGIRETGTTPTYYTIFQGGDQSGDLTYTLPTGYPTSSGYALTATTGGVMSWADISGATLLTDGGAISYLTATGDNLAVGGSTSSAPLYMDVANNTLRLGSGATNNAVLNMYASDGDTGSITYNTSDTWAFSGGNINLADDMLLTLGTDGDSVITGRASAISANTAVSGLIIGTPIVGDIGANSTIFSNITTDADMIFAVNSGGNSTELLRLDGSAGSVTIGTGNVAIATDSNGNVGIGTTSPQALLHLAAGTTTTAPLKFTSGTNLTSATAGSVEFDGTRFYLSPSTTRYTIPMSTSTGNTLLFTAGGNYTITFPATGTAGLIGSSQTWSGTNTYSGQVAISKAGAASSAALSMTGALYTGGNGTTTFPYIYYNKGASAVTTFNTNGTVLGMNAASGFAGNFADFHVNGGTSVFTVNSSGGIYAAGDVGIGTDNPSDMLDIYGITNKLRLSYDDTNYATLSAESDGDLAFHSSNSAEAAIFIGNSTAGQDVSLQFDEETQDYYFGVDNTDHFLKMGLGSVVGTTPYFTMDTSGKIGIGDASPAYGGLVVAAGVVIGSDADQNALIDDATNGTGSTLLYIGQNTIDTTAPSDARLKRNIVNTNLTLAQLLELNVVDFQYIPEFSTDQTLHSGLIAQQVEQIYPYAVSVRSDGYKMINYDRFTPLLIQSIQEQQDAIAGISNSQLLISNQVQNSNDQIAGLVLKTDQNISTVGELQSSVDEQLALISNSQLSISNQFSSINDQMALLQSQIDELKKLNNQELNVAQIEANTADIDTLKLLLGFDRVQNPGDVNLLGKLEADGVVAGAFTVKVTDVAKRTIGENYIKAVVVDANLDGLDDVTGDDGKTYIIQTTAVNAQSRIFVTPKSAIDQTVAVTEIVAGESFKVEIKNPVTTDLKFNWLIVEEQ